VRSAINKQEVERAELEAVLASRFLGRTNNLVRLLSFVCEKYFDGAFDEIKEYSIAVQALGRPENFDPQVDTIVRVTAHALRKRLEDYYRTTGAAHPIHICLPPGHYVPRFIHVGEPEAEVHPRPQGNGTDSVESASVRGNGLAEGVTQPLQTNGSADRSGQSKPVEPSAARWHRRSVWTAAGIVLAAGVISALVWYRSTRTSRNDARTLPQAAALTTVSGQGLRAIAGDNRTPYVDRSGATWESDQFCTGGNSFSVHARAIQGTEDPQLFLSGRQGAFRCRYAVPPGTYEVHLLFAETSGLLENSRHVAFSINGAPPVDLDVVDDAGGDDVATTKVFTDIKPASDGTIHVDFNGPDSFLNAIEILPGVPHGIVPVRIVAGPSLYRDSSGNVWMPDRYFFGGRVNRFGKDVSKIPDGGLFEWHRYGHFHYVVPVVPGARYTLKLYFLEHWFGVEVGSAGGVGSRVFDVSCDGRMLLQGFDIFREAGSSPLVKTFTHIEPTPQGKLEIYFTPSPANYPSITAIEVLSE
jgi:Malectin domain